MAFTEFHYYSETLEIDVSVNVILPETRIMAQQEGKPLPTLYLLHGLSDDHTHWCGRPVWSSMPANTVWPSSCPVSTVPSIRI